MEKVVQSSTYSANHCEDSKVCFRHYRIIHKLVPPISQAFKPVLRCERGEKYRLVDGEGGLPVL